MGKPHIPSTLYAHRGSLACLWQIQVIGAFPSRNSIVIIINAATPTKSRIISSADRMIRGITNLYTAVARLLCCP